MSDGKCGICAAAPPEFADGLRLWHDSGHAHLDRTGVHPAPAVSEAEDGRETTMRRCMQDTLCTLPDGNHEQHYDCRDGLLWPNYNYDPSAAVREGERERLVAAMRGALWQLDRGWTNAAVATLEDALAAPSLAAPEGTEQ